MSDVEDGSHSSCSNSDENEEVEETKKPKRTTMNMPKGFRGWLKGLKEKLEKSEVSRVDFGLEEMKKLARGNRGLLFARNLEVGQDGKKGWRIMWAGKVLQNSNENASLMFLPKGKEDEGMKVHVYGNWEDEGNKEKNGNVVAFKRRAGKQKAGNVELVEMVRKTAKEIAADVFQLVSTKM